MKKIFLIILCFCIFNETYAKIPNGKKLLGIATSLNSGADLLKINLNKLSSESKFKSTELNIAPRFGVFVDNNIVLGIDINLEYDFYESQKNFYSRGGPFMRFYFNGKNVVPFIEVSGAYGEMISKYSSEIERVKYGIASYGGGFGLAFPIGDYVNLDLMAEYMRYYYSDNDNFSKYDDISIKFGFVFIF